MAKNLKFLMVIATIVFVVGSYVFFINSEMHRFHTPKVSMNLINHATAANNLVNNTTNNLAYNSSNDTTNDSIISANMEAHKNLSYNLPNKPTFILRLDDVQASLWGEACVRIINDTLSRNLSLSIAVIPDRDSPKTDEVMECIREHKDDPHLEITQHGFNHSYSEYDNISENETRLKTMKGLRKLYQDYDVSPVTFIPPNNEDNSNNNITPDTLWDMGFRIISTSGDLHYAGDILDVGHNAATTEYTGGNLTDPGQIIRQCEKDFKKQNLSVIMIHPQDFVNNNRTLNESKYANYLELLNELNYTGAQSITFRDMLKVSKTI